MGRLSRLDENHIQIKRELQAITVVRDVSYQAGFGCDLIARHMTTWAVVLLEIKLPRSRNRLTESELELQGQFPDSYHVVTTVAEALAAIGYKAPPMTSDHLRTVLPVK